MERISRRLSPAQRRPVGWALFLLSLILILPCMALPTAAVEPEAPPQSADVGVVLLINLENNITLYEKEADTNIYPSSSVKIMAGLLLCRALEGRLEEEVTITSAMLSGVEGRKMIPPLAVGEKLKVKDILYAAVTGGYNDATHVAAILAADSVAAFVEQMNTEALRLGTAHTRYTNPTGIHDPKMCTTARDLSIIAREAYGNKLFMKLTSERVYTLPATNIAGERTFTNRNSLISDSSQNYFNGYCRGMNAGMTDEGGWCVVTVCERGGASNLCIVMRGKDVASGELIPAYVYTNRLLSWSNRAYANTAVLLAGDTLETRKVAMTGVSKSKAALTVKEDLKVYLPQNADPETDLVYDVRLTGDELTAPLSAGDVVGQVVVTYNGSVVGKADLTVTEDFSTSIFLLGLMGFKDYLMSRPFVITVIIFVLLLLLYIRIVKGPGGRYDSRVVNRRRVKLVKRRYC